MPRKYETHLAVVALVMMIAAVVLLFINSDSLGTPIPPVLIASLFAFVVPVAVAFAKRPDWTYWGGN